MEASSSSTGYFSSVATLYCCCCHSSKQPVAYAVAFGTNPAQIVFMLDGEVGLLKMTLWLKWSERTLCFGLMQVVQCCSTVRGHTGPVVAYSFATRCSFITGLRLTDVMSNSARPANIIFPEHLIHSVLHSLRKANTWYKYIWVKVHIQN